MKYKFEITDSALDLIRAQARYIAVDCQAPLNAGRWLEQVWDVVDGLELMPHRHNLAPEDAFKVYEVRRALVGDYLLLFTIDEPAGVVWSLGSGTGVACPDQTSCRIDYRTKVDRNCSSRAVPAVTSPQTT